MTVNGGSVSFYIGEEIYLPGLPDKSNSRLKEATYTLSEKSEEKRYWKRKGDTDIANQKRKAVCDPFCSKPLPIPASLLLPSPLPKSQSQCFSPELSSMSTSVSEGQPNNCFDSRRKSLNTLSVQTPTSLLEQNLHAQPFQTKPQPRKRKSNERRMKSQFDIVDTRTKSQLQPFRENLAQPDNHMLHSLCRYNSYNSFFSFGEADTLELAGLCEIKMENEDLRNKHEHSEGGEDKAVVKERDGREGEGKQRRMEAQIQGRRLQSGSPSAQLAQPLPRPGLSQIPEQSHRAEYENEDIGVLNWFLDVDHRKRHQRYKSSSSESWNKRNQAQRRRVSTTSTIATAATTESNRSTKTSVRWTEREDIFLAGIILDIYYRRHSLKPSKSEKNEAEREGLSGETLIWKRIQDRYHLACSRYQVVSGEVSAERSIRAMQKRWALAGTGSCQAAEKEEIHKRVGFHSPETPTNFEELGATIPLLLNRKRKRNIPVTKIYEHIWEEMYNKDEILTCPAEEFNEFAQSIEQSSSRNYELSQENQAMTSWMMRKTRN